MFRRVIIGLSLMCASVSTLAAVIPTSKAVAGRPEAGAKSFVKIYVVVVSPSGIKNYWGPSTFGPYSYSTARSYADYFNGIPPSYQNYNGQRYRVYYSASVGRQ